jgi:GDP/UDP-N,N'-diacetylbacillosamine 2-epimerase (hydrolysing)
MHLLPKFGHTIRDIQAQAYDIAAQVPMYKPNESPHLSLARGIQGIGRALESLKPDLLFLLGDRLEMLAAANAALALRIPIAHLHGGESARGIWDEQIRHAITKMAHLHFCATSRAQRRIIQMGEDPRLDAAIAAQRDLLPVIPNVRVIAGTNPLLLLHPSSADIRLEYRRALVLIKALKSSLDWPFVYAVGPNNDPGHQGILQAYRENSDYIKLEMSMPQNVFWLKLITSGLLIGNSSAGIIEAASFATPVINLGCRQQGRERNANIIDVAWQPRAIAAAIEKSLSDQNFLRQVLRRKNIYGDGHAAERVVKILERAAAKGVLVEKQFCDASSQGLRSTLK